MQDTKDHIHPLVPVLFRDLGRIRYGEAWDYQEQLFSEVLHVKQINEELPACEKLDQPNYLLFCEHEHVYTLGKSGKEQNLLADSLQLRAKDAEFYKINRGGDITYHGPGQIVGYPIINMESFGLSVREYIFKLEESVIRTLDGLGIHSSRLDGATGVWLDAGNPSKARKICAIGVRTSRYVTMHGFAFNVNTDLSYFDLINPCGFTDKGVTSVARELDREIEMEDVKGMLKEEISSVFGMSYLD